MMKKILITGAAGYIGSCLFSYLKKKYEVYGLDKVKNNNKFFYKVDLINIKLTNQILKKLQYNSSSLFIVFYLSLLLFHLLSVYTCTTH